jgi:hypothetical protein
MSFTVINSTTVDAKSVQEISRAKKAVATALLGTWGSAEWKGGEVDGEGWYRRQGTFWDAQLRGSFNGPTTITLPMQAYHTVVTIVPVADPQSVTTHVMETGTTLNVELYGVYIVMIHPTQVTKEP